MCLEPQQAGLLRPKGHQLLQDGTVLLLAAAVEGLLQQAARLGYVALLEQREVVWVLEGDLELAILRLLQRVQEVLGEPAQLLSREGQEGRVLIQILVEVDAQQAQPLLDALDLLLCVLREVEPVPPAQLDQPL